MNLSSAKRMGVSARRRIHFSAAGLRLIKSTYLSAVNKKIRHQWDSNRRKNNGSITHTAGASHVVIERRFKDSAEKVAREFAARSSEFRLSR